MHRAIPMSGEKKKKNTILTLHDLSFALLAIALRKLRVLNININLESNCVYGYFNTASSGFT